MLAQSFRNPSTVINRLTLREVRVMVEEAPVGARLRLRVAPQSVVTGYPDLTRLNMQSVQPEWVPVSSRRWASFPT